MLELPCRSRILELRILGTPSSTVFFICVPDGVLKLEGDNLEGLVRLSRFLVRANTGFAPTENPVV
jgi:hypothetical protein